MKLSVLMITFNHEKYISQALDSVLMQVVDFDYEIVIGEDCSTDNTRNVVLDYQQRYPDKIRALLPEENLGMMKNFMHTYQACQGGYIALLEGDDYWTSPHKLQKQVDFLEANPDFALCFHNVRVVSENGCHEPYLSNIDQDEVTTLQDVLRGYYIRTASMLFRRKFFPELPDWFVQLNNGDYALQLCLARHGKIFYINDIMSVYRLHPGGVSNHFYGNNNVKLDLSLLSLFYEFNRYSNYQFKKEIYAKFVSLYSNMIHKCRLITIRHWEARVKYLWFKCLLRFCN